MKNILVPTDFSEVSESASNYAAELAKITGAKLIFFYIYTVPVPVADTPVITLPTEDIEKENKGLLQELDARIKEKHGNLETELLTQPGFVVDEITTYTKENEIDLVVMGVTGAGKAPGILGSNATAVMHHATCPVIIIPKGHTFIPPAIVALACDYKSIVPDETVDKLKNFVRIFNSTLLVFHVLNPKELATYQKAATEVNLENSLADTEHTLYFPASENLVGEINNFVNQHKVDVLAVFPHTYSFLKGLTHHSISKDLAFLTQVPLLSIHE